MKEPRRYVRLDARVRVTYTVLHEEQPRHSVTSDISGGGICFYASDPLVPGTRLKVDVTLPGQEATIPFTAEVLWSERSAVVGGARQERAVEIGVRFAEIAPDDQEAIMRYVRSSLQPPRVEGQSDS